MTEAAKTDSANKPIRSPWWITTLALLVAAWVQNEMAYQYVIRADQGLSPPAIVEVASQLTWLLYAAALIPLSIGLLAGKIRLVNHPSFLTSFSCVALFCHIAFAYMFLIPEIYLYSGGPPRRLPNRVVDQLHAAREITIYSISRETESVTLEKFHGNSVLGRITLTRAAMKDEIATAIISTFETNRASAALCFSPRHGLRILSDDSSTDLVICYQCSRMQIVDDQGETVVTIPRDTKVLLNRHLSAAGIELAKE